jgi:hypothetical protein
MMCRWTTTGMLRLAYTKYQPTALPQHSTPSLGTLGGPSDITRVGNLVDHPEIQQLRTALDEVQRARVVDHSAKLVEHPEQVLPGVIYHIKKVWNLSGFDPLGFRRPRDVNFARLPDVHTNKVYNMHDVQTELNVGSRSYALYKRPNFDSVAFSDPELF